MSDSVVSSALMPTSLSPAARMPPRAFGPRTRIAVSARASTRSSPRPAASATSNQRRTPYAVVASSTSGRASMIARVSAITGSSEIAFAMRSVGACTTCAPRRASASMRSAERRSLVTPMRNPSSWSGRNAGRRLHRRRSRGHRRECRRALHEIGCLGVAVVREAHDLADDDDRGRGHAAPARRRTRCRRGCRSSCAGRRWNPRSTIATGMSTRMPWRARPAVSEGSEFTPMSTTIVPPRPARCVSSVVGERRVARHDGEEMADAAVGERDPGGAGHRDGARDAGDDLDRDAGPVAGEHLLAAATEHVGVAALEPHHVTAGERVLDEQLLDLVLRDRRGGPGACRRR